MISQYNIFKLFVILFFILYAKSLMAGCDAYISNPMVNVKTDNGKIYYDNTKSNSQFPSKPYSSTMGLTVSELKQNISGDVDLISQPDGTFCVVLKTVDAYVGFPRVDVYIDKKYKPGSCNYKVIREHENYHVRVQREGLDFFTPKIRQAIQIASKKIKTDQVFSESQAKSVAQSMFTRIQNDIKPTMDFVKKRLKEENMVIDTQASYEEESKKCPKW